MVSGSTDVERCGGRGVSGKQKASPARKERKWTKLSNRKETV